MGSSLHYQQPNCDVSISMLASVELSIKTECKKPEHSSYKIDEVNAKNMIRAWVFSLPDYH